MRPRFSSDRSPNVGVQAGSTPTIEPAVSRLIGLCSREQFDENGPYLEVTGQSDGLLLSYYGDADDGFLVYQLTDKFLFGLASSAESTSTSNTPATRPMFLRTTSRLWNNEKGTVMYSRTTTRSSRRSMRRGGRMRRGASGARGDSARVSTVSPQPRHSSRLPVSSTTSRSTRRQPRRTMRKHRWCLAAHTRKVIRKGAR